MKMKKLFCLILTAVMLMMPLSPAMAARTNGGDSFILRGYAEGVLSVESIYMDPHDGPGYEYRPVSLNLPKGTAVKVLTQAKDWQGNRWVLVESGNIRAYLIQQDRSGRRLIDCSLSNVPEEPAELYDTWICMTYTDTRLLYGPGTTYQKSPYTAKAFDYGYVVLMNGNWALVEFQGDYDGITWLGDGEKARGWMEFSELQY